MATPIGTNTVNSVGRRFLIKNVVDNVYGSNPLLFRTIARHQKVFDGGFQIEQPIAWSHMAAGGWYSGFDLLDITPSDTVKNAAWDFKQAYVPISVDGGTLTRMNSDQSVVNFIGTQFKQGETELKDIIGNGLFSNLSNPKQLDGLQGAIDNGAVAATYGGLARSANTFWNAQVSTAVAPLSFIQLMTLMGNCTSGGQRPTIIITTQAVYNLIWALSTGVNSTSGVPGQAFPVQAGGEDVQLAQAGFSNIVFNGVPVIVDSHCPAGQLYMVNEEYLHLYVSPERDFYLRDFVVPPNQDAYTSLIMWLGNLIITNLLRQGKMLSIVA